MSRHLQLLACVHGSELVVLVVHKMPIKLGNYPAPNHGAALNDDQRAHPFPAMMPWSSRERRPKTPFASSFSECRRMQRKQAAASVFLARQRLIQQGQQQQQQ